MVGKAWWQQGAVGYIHNQKAKNRREVVLRLENLK